MIGRNFFARRKLRAVLSRIVSDSYEDNDPTTISYTIQEVNIQFKLGLSEQDQAEVLRNVLFVLPRVGYSGRAQLVADTAFYTFTAALYAEEVNV